MGIVVSFDDFTPPARFDATPWTGLSIEESATVDGTYAEIDTITFVTPDPDPANPGARDFTTDQGTAVGYWYRIIFVDGAANTSNPTAPIQNAEPGTAPTAYADLDEFARILKIRAPTDAQNTAMRRALYAAAAEIDSELGREDQFAVPYPALVVQVNLARAEDLWRHTESMPGITGLLGDEGGAVTPARYSWERYAQMLAPLKETWGLA